jgi:HSP20 family protein
VVRADVPGIDPERDVDITVTDDALHIEVRREEKTEHKDKSGYRTEVRYGEFSRSIPLPLGVSQEGIGATYKDGVIEVRVKLPEKSGTSPTKIRVSRSGSPASDQSPEAPENSVT